MANEEKAEQNEAAEKPALKLLDNPRQFVGPQAWAFLGARKVWNHIYLGLYAGRSAKELLFEHWPELVAFDLVSNHFIEADRKQGGNAWAKRVAWWDNTAAQRQQIVDAVSDDYVRWEKKLEEKNNG